LVQYSPSHVVSHSACPLIFANQGRYFQAIDGTYWLVGLGTAYPLTPGTSHNQFRYTQGVVGDATGTQWQTYGGGATYQIMDLQSIASSNAIGSDRFFMANPSNGSVVDPNNHIHMTFSDSGGKAWYVEVALDAG